MTCSVQTGRGDFGGTLAVSKEAPVGFRAIRVGFRLDTAPTVEQLDRPSNNRPS